MPFQLLSLFQVFSNSLFFYFSPLRFSFFLCISIARLITRFCSCFLHPHISVQFTVSDHTHTSKTQIIYERERPKLKSWRGERIRLYLWWETSCAFLFGWWCVWEITHYFIVLVFGGKALLKLSPSFSPLFLSNYIPPSLPAPSFSFLYISTNYFLTLCSTFFLSSLNLSPFSLHGSV